MWRKWLSGLSLAIGMSACGGSSDPPSASIPIGVLLSYSGDLAANSVNNERALQMALEAANRAGGLVEAGGTRPVGMVARDTHGDLTQVTPAAQELLAAGATLIIGPDTAALAVQLKPLLSGRTMLMPSFTTSDSDLYKPNSWFVMGAGPLRIACELNTQLTEDGRKMPVVLMDPAGYNVRLGRELGFTYGLRQIFLPSDDVTNPASVQAILATPADSYVLATSPASASALLYTLAALGGLGDPTRWYLSPTLHTPALLETIPEGMMGGARGVATGTGPGTTADFDRAFAQRWGDQPLDDAYPFYDAAAVAVLALQRALVKEQAIPGGTGLAAHVVAVTQAGGAEIGWDRLAEGLTALRAGQEIEYVGISGRLRFDITGKSASGNTNWWRVVGRGFAGTESRSTCRNTGTVTPQ